MLFDFISKETSSRQNDEIILELAQFIIENKEFLGITLSILGDIKKPMMDTKIIEFIKVNPRYDACIMDNPAKNKFIDLMKATYNTDQDTLNSRRGRLLELVWIIAGPCDKNMKRFGVIEEALVYYDKIKLSDRDVDIVYRDKSIEVHECKACAENTLRSPIKTSSKEKMELMEKVKVLADKDNIGCQLYIITLDPKPNHSKRLLSKYNFNSIKVICRKDIEKTLCS